MYCLAIIVLIYGFTKVNTIQYTGVKPKTKFSIIVPFRNEAENLPVLLESLSKLNYPMELFEVILVDDESEEVFSVQCSVFSAQCSDFCQLNTEYCKLIYLGLNTKNGTITSSREMPPCW